MPSEDGETTEQSSSDASIPPPPQMATDSSGGVGGGGESSSGISSGDGGSESPIRLDVGAPDIDPGSSCAAPPPVTCDQFDDDPWHALGLNCPGGPQVEGSVSLTGPEQLYIHSGNLGTFVPPPYPPREGNKFVVLSSGSAQDITVPGLFADTQIDFGDTPLPAPIRTNSVSVGDDCEDDPGLVGTGDCSNTVEEQWSQGSGSFDYAEMRMSVVVPPGTPGLSYDFAMFSTEYPEYYQTEFNDMYIAWLESERWTGNISFDDMGNPISLNAGFLDYKDAPNPADCPPPCEAPELQGTAMENHAGTRWLTTTAGVVPGETIELIFAIFDLSDAALDTVILLDNFQWSCEGGGPATIPG